ncbi:MAG: peptidylprolyl isomerase, partial [Prosthecobacter sp.]
LALRILRTPAAPQIQTPVAAQTIAIGANSTVNLSTSFADPDTDEAVRISTTKGNLDVVLYSTLTPGTVANFKAYNYAGTLFHRAPTGFVLQGGGYTSFQSPDVFESLTRLAPITNEPGISNVALTLAMAKTADDPDSATSEFFVSFGNNSANLDNQNGGFSVFGRVASVSTSVLNTLGAVPTSNYNVKLREGGITPSSTNFAFQDIPIDQTPVPASIDQTKLMKINAVTSLPVMTYAITVLPNSAVATAPLHVGQLQITGVAPGTTSVTVSATDVDGNSTSQTVNITVPKTTASIVLAGLVQTYNGTARSASATTTPVGLPFLITYDGSSSAPTAHGSYAVSAVISDTTYQGSTTGTLVIRGIPVADWRTAHFSSLQISDGSAADTANPDGDGWSNLAEYALGMNPNSREPALQPLRDANGLTLTFTRPKDLPDVLYGAESSESLAAGSWNSRPVEVITDGAIQTIRVRDPLTTGSPERRFIRLRFSLAAP